jgi:hypothetical protein
MRFYNSICFTNIEEDIDGYNEDLEEESVCDMTNSSANSHNFDSSLLEYESEIYEYLKEAEVCLKYCL